VGGNPAGVVLNADELSEADMQQIAAQLGYSESAFLAAGDRDRTFDVRYFAPAREVPFCGHATIASAVALAERQGTGPFLFRTAAGPVRVATRIEDGLLVAELTSVPPKLEEPSPGLVTEVLNTLRWSAQDLDPAYPPQIVDAGSRHLILVTRTRERLALLEYDFDALRSLMTQAELITLALVWPDSSRLYYARNPSPVGGVVEDPATGSAAAALGAYLRALGVVPPDASFEIRQGTEMGRPSRLTVRLVPGEDEVRVSGAAASIS
jgi:PhzF family phenazine biosynthesis protein